MKTKTEDRKTEDRRQKTEDERRKTGDGRRKKEDKDGERDGRASQSQHNTTQRNATQHNTTQHNTMHNRTQQKQHNRNSTQHRIIVDIHPLPFRSIAGVRILHRCSHLACYHCSSLLGRVCFVHVKFDIARLVLLWSVLLLHHAGSRNRPEPGTGIVHEIGLSKADVV